MADSGPERRQPMTKLLALPGFLIRKLSPRGRRIFAAAAAVVLVTAAIGTAILVPRIADSKQDRAERDAAAQARRQAADERLQRNEQRPRTARLPAGSEPGRATERAILADSHARARAGTLRSRPVAVSCRRAAKPSVPGTAYECLAETRAISRGGGQSKAAGAIGYPYRAVADPVAGGIVLCRVIQRAGEGGLDNRRLQEISPRCGG